MLITATRMKAKPEKGYELVQTLSAWTALSRRETGCLGYHLYRDLEDENAFYLVGEWASKQDVNRHLRSPHFAVLLGTQTLLREASEFQLLDVSRTAGMEAVKAVRQRVQATKEQTKSGVAGGGRLARNETNPAMEPPRKSTLKS